MRDNLNDVHSGRKLTEEEARLAKQVSRKSKDLEQLIENAGRIYEVDYPLMLGMSDIPDENGNRTIVLRADTPSQFLELGHLTPEGETHYIDDRDSQVVSFIMLASLMTGKPSQVGVSKKAMKALTDGLMNSTDAIDDMTTEEAKEYYQVLKTVMHVVRRVFAEK